MQSPWSEWEWNDGHSCYCRYQVLPLGEYKWDYSPVENNATATRRVGDGFQHEPADAAVGGDPSNLSSQWGASTNLQQYTPSQSDAIFHESGRADPKSVLITLLGASGLKVNTVALVDDSTDKNFISSDTVKELNLRSNVKKASKHGSTSDKGDKTITIEWKETQSGSYTMATTFNIGRNLSAGVVFGFTFSNNNMTASSSRVDMTTPSNSLRVESGRFEDRYESVKVHLIRWEDEGVLQCRDEVEELKDTFESDRFRLTCTEFMIPSAGANRAFQSNLEGVISGCGPRDLLILYYAGHGRVTDGRFEFQSDANGTRVQWNPVRAQLERTYADVLLLLDTCFSEAMTRGPRPPATKISIAACDRHSETAPPGPCSYTYALVDVLQQMDWNSFSANLIYQKITSQRRRLLASYGVEAGTYNIHYPVKHVFSGSTDITLVGPRRS